jgi:hypothetical protein
VSPRKRGVADSLLDRGQESPLFVQMGNSATAGKSVQGAYFLLGFDAVRLNGRL